MISPPLMKGMIDMCKTVCRLCPKLVLSQAVTFADGTVTVNLPAGSYNSGEVYCIVIAQTIPTTATIGANVVITVGDGTDEYPLTNSCCAPVTACGIRTRTRYAVRVVTTASGGSFKMIGRPACAPTNNLSALDGGTAATEAT